MQELLSKGFNLERRLDQALQIQAEDTPEAAFADWAWFRYGTFLVLLRDEANLSTAATIARGLLEEAARWDWSMAHGESEWICSQMLIEYQRLKTRAGANSALWLHWILPPGLELVVRPGVGTANVPADARQVVRRFGHGLSPDLLNLFPIQAFNACYSWLDVAAHGNLAAAYAAASDQAFRYGEPFRALLLHLGAASTVATTCSLVGFGAKHAEILRLARELAEGASPVHGLSIGGEPVTERQEKLRTIEPLSISSSISRLPEIPERLNIRAGEFLNEARRVTAAVTAEWDPEDAISQAAYYSFANTAFVLDILSGVLANTIGPALLPFAARPVFEEAGRWGWIISASESDVRRVSKRLQGYFEDVARRVSVAERRFREAGVEKEVSTGLLGNVDVLPLIAERGAEQVEDSELMPDRMEDLLNTVYSSMEAQRWASDAYAILTQFVHVTGIAIQHVRPGQWHSLTAPMYALTLDTLASGFVYHAYAVALLSGHYDARISAMFEDLQGCASDLLAEANRLHFLR